jgi:phage protein D
MATELAIYGAAPEVLVDGSPLQDGAALLEALTVDEHVGGLSSCEVVLANWGSPGGNAGYLVTTREVIDFGATLEVVAGPDDERRTVFSGRITGIEANYPADAMPTLTMLAEDAAQDLRMTRRTRTFTDVTDADIVERIARDHELRADVDLPGPSHREVGQVNRSDLAFLRDRVATFGADVWLDNGTLHVGKRDDEPIVLRFGIELREVSIMADLSGQSTEQRVSGWDQTAKEAVDESAGASDLGAELAELVPGATALDEAFGGRPAVLAVPGSLTASAARELAVGLMRDRARRFVTGTATADGLPMLRAGRTVTLQRLGSMFDGDYRLARVVHRYDTIAGYRTDIEIERMGVGR